MAAPQARARAHRRGGMQYAEEVGEGYVGRIPAARGRLVWEWRGSMRVCLLCG